VAAGGELVCQYGQLFGGFQRGAAVDYLGVLWLRTRNLLLIAVVHAMNDLLPFTADHLRTWL
jgi:hypothetical protein